MSRLEEIWKNGTQNHEKELQDMNKPDSKAENSWADVMEEEDENERQKKMEQNIIKKAWADMVEEEEEERKKNKNEEEKETKREEEEEERNKDMLEDQLEMKYIQNLIDKDLEKWRNNSGYYIQITAAASASADTKKKKFLDNIDPNEREAAYKIQKKNEDYPGIAKTILAGTPFNPNLRLRTTQPVVTLQQKISQQRQYQQSRNSSKQQQQKQQHNNNKLVFIKVRHWRAKTDDPRFIVYNKLPEEKLLGKRRSGKENDNNNQVGTTTTTTRTTRKRENKKIWNKKCTNEQVMKNSFSHLSKVIVD